MNRIGKTYLSRYVAAALTVGLFGFAPVAYALPVVDGTHTNTVEASIDTTTANQMGIKSTVKNNVMNWQSFSIAKNETVTFDKNNYLNLVRGASKSEIDGVMSGGGNIYLINPNGILFGATAQVNVGNLVASTRAISDEAASNFTTNGTNPLAATVTSAAGDIVNLGKLQTASVVLEGNNITIQNAADITSDGTTALTDKVAIKADGLITVGHSLGDNTVSRSFKIRNIDNLPETVHNYANDTYAGSGYKTSKLDGATENAVKESMLVENVYDLQNMDAKPDGNYMLAGDISVSGGNLDSDSNTSDWNHVDNGPYSFIGYTGFMPIKGFTGTFDGATHVIKGLYIKRSSESGVGLFSSVSKGTIQNVGMEDSAITGYGEVGAVVGDATDSSTIRNVYNTGAVACTGTSGNNVGGVVGAATDSIIKNAYNTGTVSGAGNDVGGVVGENGDSTITNAYNTGAVTSTGSNISNVGGVVGWNNSGTITNAYNTGTVTSTESNISNVGGVVGWNNSGTITNAYNTGTVTSTGSNSNDVGGVVGENGGGTITNAYNTGVVTGTGSDSNYVGGVVGENGGGTITNVYNTGTVSGVNYVGGVVGDVDGGTITNALWNTDVSTESGAPTQAVGNQSDTATVKGVTLAELKQASTYDSWKDASNNKIVATTGNAGTAWRIYDGYTTPLLTSLFKGAVTVMNKQTTTYNKTSQTADLSAAVYDAAVDTEHIFACSGTNAGTYDLFYSDQQGYDLVNDKNFIINPITLTATLNAPASTFTKKYDGTNSVSQGLGNYYILNTSSVISGDVIEGLDTTKASGVYADKNVGDNKTITFSGFTLTGADAGNYTIAGTLSGAVGQITQREITPTLTGSNSFIKVYDGNNEVTTALSQGTNYAFGANDIIGADAGKINLAATSGTYTDKTVATGKTVTFQGLTLTGTEAGNYKLTTTSLSGNVGQITQKEITAALTGTNSVTKVYDGNTNVTAALTKDTNYQFTGLVNGDTLGLTGTGAYADKNVNDGKAVSFTGLSLTGKDMGNYNLTTTSLSGNVGRITQKDLTATLLDGQSVAKVYDGTTTVTTALVKDKNYSLPDLVNGDVVTLTASGTYDNKNAGTGKQVSFTSLGLIGKDAGNYNLKTKELSGAIGQITQKAIAAEIKSGSTFAKEYDGTDVVTTALVKDTNYVLPKMVSGDDLSLDTAKISGTYTAGKDVGNDLSVIFTGLKLTGKDAGNYDLLDFAMGENYGKITPKALTATLTGDNVFTKVYDGTTAVSQALGTNYTLDGIVADSDKVSLSAGSGAYNDKNAGDNKTITFSGLTLTGTGAGNYTIASTLSGAVGQITRKTITGALASGYSFDKTYDGTTTAQLGNGYTLSGVVAGDTVPLTAANGFYDSSAIGDRTVTFSGFSINNGNYLLSMADSLSGIGKITSGIQDHNYNNARTAISSFFGADHKDGYTIFGGTPEDYIVRAVTQNNGQSYQVGVAQVTQTWYNGPTTITIVNGGITLPKDILLGSTYDTRTVVIKGADS